MSHPDPTKTYEEDEIEFNKNKCKKCGYKWIPRVKLSKQCPNCKRQINYKIIT